jgi:hypothetical protein
MRDGSPRCVDRGLNFRITLVASIDTRSIAVVANSVTTPLLQRSRLSSRKSSSASCSSPSDPAISGPNDRITH